MTTTTDDTTTTTSTEAINPVTAEVSKPITTEVLPEVTPATSVAPVADETPDDQPEPDTFPRAYVQQLRDESARYRQRAQRADGLAQQLHTALVTATGRLEDASDLPYDETHLDDPAALQDAIEDLLARKPHLGSRTPRGNIGQGATRSGDDVSLAGILRANA